MRYERANLFVAAGFPEAEIGDTLADVSKPVALARLSVDEPVPRMTFPYPRSVTGGPTWT